MAVLDGAPGPTEQQLGLRRRSDQIVLLRLRRRAAQKVMRASRIATLRLAGLPHEEARARMELSVQQYKHARAWLTAAVTESLGSEGLLTVDQALQQYSERHIAGVVRLGLLKDRGSSEAAIRKHLGISREQYAAGWEWWRDASSGLQRTDE